MARQNLKSKQKNGANSKFTEEPFGKSHRSCKGEFDLRYINCATKFGEKNPTENGNILSLIFLGYLL